MKKLANLLVLVVLAAWLTGCTVTQDEFAKKTIVSANALQDAAAHAYKDASLEEQAAGAFCVTVLCPGNQPTALNTVGCPLPPPSPMVLALCEKAGAPIPYDPDKLAALAKPINAAYEAVRAAEAARLAVKAGQAPNGLSEALALAGMAVLRVYAGANELGIKLPMADALKLAQAVGQ